VNIENAGNCVIKCLQHPECQSINFHVSANPEHVCELNSKTDNDVTLTVNSDVIYYGPTLSKQVNIILTDLVICTLIWTLITHLLVHMHHKKKIAPKIRCCKCKRAFRQTSLWKKHVPKTDISLTNMYSEHFITHLLVRMHHKKKIAPKIRCCKCKRAFKIGISLKKTCPKDRHLLN
jgi:hypothetical protein